MQRKWKELDYRFGPRGTAHLRKIKIFRCLEKGAQKHKKHVRHSIFGVPESSKGHTKIQALAEEGGWGGVGGGDNGVMSIFPHFY